MTAQELAEFIARSGHGEELSGLFQKLGFSVDFVAQQVLSHDGPVTVSRVAMLWMGMPNKHDRKRTRQLFDALTEIGLLQAQGDDETWLPTASAGER